MRPQPVQSTHQTAVCSLMPPLSDTAKLLTSFVPCLGHPMLRAACVCLRVCGTHCRCVHRGAFFTTMKTTTVRKLLPESWGFLCPVHTPDGSPCGLLNHLTVRTGAIVTIGSKSAATVRFDASLESTWLLTCDL